MTWCSGLFAAMALLASGRSRGAGMVIAGGFLFLLGFGSILPDLPILDTLPVSFVAVSAGFIWAGVALAKWGIFAALRRRDEMTIAKLGPLVVPVVVALGTVSLVTLLYVTRAILLAASWQGLVVAVGFAGSGVFLATLVGMARPGRAWKWLDDRWLTRWSTGTPAIFPGRTQLKGASAVVAFLIAVAVPHFALAALAIVVGTFLLHDALRPAGKVPRWGAQPFIVLVALLASTWFIWTIAGADLPLTIDGLREAPFSAAAEMALAPMLGLAAWALLGLWPFHGAGPGSALSFLGGLLLVRWGNGIIPAGMEHIAPLAGIVAVLAALHAAARRRGGELAAALGVLAVAPSGIAAWPFFVLGSVPATLWIIDRKSPVPGLDRQQLVGVALLPALAWALPTMLRGETVLTVVAVVLGAALFLAPKE